MDILTNLVSARCYAGKNRQFIFSYIVLVKVEELCDNLMRNLTFIIPLLSGSMALLRAVVSQSSSRPLKIIVNWGIAALINIAKSIKRDLSYEHNVNLIKQ